MKEIIISKGKGQLTKDAEYYLLLLCKNIYLKFIHRYKNRDDQYDMYVGGVYAVLKSYRKFNEKKYDKCIPFFTEVFKRGVVQSFNHIKLWKTYTYMDLQIVRYDSEDRIKNYYII